MVITDKDDLIKDFITAFGLPENLIAFTIKARVGHLVEVYVEFYPEHPSERVEFKKYNLVQLPRIS